MENKMVEIPEWAFEFHENRCPAMPIGYSTATGCKHGKGIVEKLNYAKNVFHVQKTFRLI